MTSQLRKGIVERKPEIRLDGEVECDEVYVVAGHKGHPEAVKNRKGRRNRLKGARGRGTLEKEKPPIFGMIKRGGEVVIRMLENVKQKTIQPLIQVTISPETLIYTDEYDIYSRLESWGYSHKTVCHSRGEYARDEDSDGFHEVHVNTMEGFWSLLRSWLRPHRGISQESLPVYIGFFEFVHNARKRGKKLMDALLRLFLAPST
jgi:transposase-like protein